MKKNVFLIVCLFLVNLMVGCGGGGGTTNTAGPPVVGKGVFVDGPVTGLGFQSGSKSGITKNNGEFEYEQGRSVKFYLGDIVIGETTGDSVVTLLHLVPGSDTANAKVLKLTRFLLSVGKTDPQTSVITIPEAVFTAAKGKTINFDTISDADLLEMVKVLNKDPNSVLVSNEEANNHLTANILNIYGGTYQGIFTGRSTSTKWEMIIDPVAGTVTGKGLDGYNETITGSITNGVVFSGQAQLGCTLTGSIDVTTKELKGTWKYNDDPGRNGTFTGKKI